MKGRWSNGRRTFETSSINFEINLDLNWSKKSVIVITNVADQGVTFSLTDTNPYVPGVTLSTEDNAKLLEKVKSGFKRTITRNKYQSKYQGINRLFFYYLKTMNNEKVTNDIISGL